MFVEDGGEDEVRFGGVVKCCEQDGCSRRAVRAGVGRRSPARETSSNSEQQ